MLIFRVGNNNGQERFTNNYNANSSYRMAEAEDAQTWHLRCIVRNHDNTVGNPNAYSVTMWAFGLNSANSFGGSDRIYTETLQYDDDAVGLHPNLGSVHAGGVPCQIARFSTLDNPVDVSGKSSFAFKLEDTLTPGTIFGDQPFSYDMHAYFTIRWSDVQYLSVRFDFDDANGNASQQDEVRIDRWSLRPVNVAMSDFSGTPSSNISLGNHVYQDINTSPP